MIIKNSFPISVILLLMIFEGGCRNDIETIRALTNETNLPDVTGFGIEMQYTDSGVLKGKIMAPEVYQFNKIEEPYYEFPKGMTAIFYDRNGNETSYIKANYAIYYTKKELWEGRNQVFGENKVTDEKIETSEIFWDQPEKRIYSEKFTTITRTDGIHIGEYGFDAEEDLSPIQLRGYSGKVTIRDESVAEN
jgi:LPS export ABC transporter protein LptC